MFSNKQTFGFRKAKNVTTLVGTPVSSTLKKVGVTVAFGTLVTLAGAGVVSADEVTTDTSPKTEVVATKPTEEVVEAPKEEVVVKDETPADDAHTVKEKNPNPATNLEEAQPQKTKENDASDKSSGKTSGEIVGDVTNKPFEESVEKAKDAGVVVKDNGVERASDYADATKKYESQKENLDKVTADYKEAKTRYTNDKTKYDADKADYDKKLVDYNIRKEEYERSQADLKNKIANVANNVAVEPIFSADPLVFEGTTIQDSFEFNPANNTFVWHAPYFDGVRIVGYFDLHGSLGITNEVDTATGRVKSTITNVTLTRATFTVTAGTDSVVTSAEEWIYDNNGTELAYVTFDVRENSAWDINKSYNVSQSFNLGSGEVSPQFLLGKKTSNWIVGEGSDISLRIKNNNGDLKGTLPPTPPTPPTAPVEPAIPTAEIKRYNVAQKPTIEKRVTNSDDVDVNNGLVPKNSLNKMPLVTNPMKAGRSAVEKGSYTITDALPSGLLLDLEQTVKNNPAYKITLDENKNILKGVLIDSEVDKLNANLQADYDTPDLVMYVLPQNDNGTYVNTYRLQVGNTYDIYSNKVTIYTPGGNDPEHPNPKDPNKPNDPHGSKIKPVKEVLNDDLVDINDKTVLKDSTLNYRLTWDLDQYKGIKAGSLAISKGFGYIDNYDETKVIPDIEKVSIKDSDGKDVVGLKPYVVKNLADAPKEIQELVTKAGYKVEANDEFVVWVAEDSKDFYDRYVVTGKDITFILPASIKADTKGDIVNSAQQIDFGNGYSANVVVNRVVEEDPKPVKAVKDKEGNDIQDKDVTRGQEIIYVGTWDLDQYKDMVASSVAIQKGFAFIDNYDESKVTAHLDKSTLKVNGKVVEGVKGYLIKNLADAPKEIQELVKKSGLDIQDNDEFIIWVAENPQEFFDNYVVKGENITVELPATVKDDATGDIENTMYQIDFGKGYVSNKVVNHVKVPEPVKKEKTLPNTGTKNSVGLMSVGLLLVSTLGLVGMSGYKKKEEK